MVSFGEVVVIVAFLWILLIALANRVDLTKYHLFVSSGFLLYTPPIFIRATNRLASYESFWKKLGSACLFPTILLFLTVPMILIINLIKGLFFTVSPIFEYKMIEIFRIETFVLVLPPLAFFLSLQFLISAIFKVIDGEEVERAGILLAGFIFSFFSRSSTNTKQKNRIKGLSIFVMFNLLLTLLSVPIGIGLHSATLTAYGEPDGAVISYILPNSPASGSELQTGDIIQAVQYFTSQFASETQDVISGASLNQVLSQIPSGTFLILFLNDSSQIQIVGIDPPTNADQSTGSYIGVHAEDFRPSKVGFLSPLFPMWLSIFFEWILNIGMLFSIYSLVPLPGSPGYQLMGEIIDRFNLDISVKNQQLIGMLSLFVLLGNILFYVL